MTRNISSLFWRFAGIMVLMLLLVGESWIRTAKADNSSWSYGVYGEVQSGYVLKDLGVMASTDPVLQAGAWASYKGFTIDIWTSTELDNGVYGKRGGDEIDFTLKYNGTIDEFNYQLTAAYYAVSFPSLGRMDDDIVELHAEVERPFKDGSATITPYMRVIQLVAIDTMPDITFVRPGVRIALPLNEKLTLRIEPAVAFNLTDGEQVAYATAGLHYDIGNNWSLKAEVEHTDNGTDPVFSIGFSNSW